MKIGARILKTGLAVGLALYLGEWLQLEPVIFAGIAAAVTVQPSLYRSWQNSLQQIQANIVGALVAIVLALSLGTEPYVIALGIVIVISINIQFKFTKSIPLAMVTVLAIMSSPADPFWAFAGDRFLLIFIGVASSIIINVFIPPRHEKRLISQLYDIHEMIALNLRIMVETGRDIRHVRKDLEQLSGKFTELEELFALYREESRYKPRRRFQQARQLVVLRHMVTLCEEGLDTLWLLEKHQDILQANETAQILIDEELHELASFQERVFLKFAGKMNPSPHDHEAFTYEQSMRPVQKALRTFKDDEELLMHLLPSILQLNSYREKLEELDQTIEHYFHSQPSQS